MKFYMVSALVICLVLSGCSPANPKDGSLHTYSLKEDLETVFDTFRRTFDESNPASALAMLDETGIETIGPQTFRAEWMDPARKEQMKNGLYSDLKKTEFLGIRQNEDWAGYYFVNNIEVSGDDIATTITPGVGVVRFHKVNNQWKIYQQVSSAMKYSYEVWGDMKVELDKIITANDILSVQPHNRAH